MGYLLISSAYLETRNNSIQMRLVSAQRGGEPILLSPDYYSLSFIFLQKSTCTQNGQNCFDNSVYQMFFFNLDRYIRMPKAELAILYHLSALTLNLKEIRGFMCLYKMCLVLIIEITLGLSIQATLYLLYLLWFWSFGYLLF